MNTCGPQPCTVVLLQTFFLVVEVGQISEAARRLHLSQPAVTGHSAGWKPIWKQPCSSFSSIS
ncbi:MAG: LysR family transcriptional regulator [Verrucomicrobia bacterium]|nr:LysR family transcriptional regulator [Verrucomicrobiota bacterium]